MRWFVCSCLVLLSPWPAWGAADVHILLSQADSAYEETAAALAGALGRDVTVVTRGLAGLSPEEMRALAQQERLLVPVGLNAVRFVAAHARGRASVLGVLVPMISTRDITWSLDPGKVAYAFIDQPAARSLALIAALFPSRARIGVVASPENGDLLRALEAEAAGRGMRVKAMVARGAAELGPALRQVLADSDVLLLVPDPLLLGGANLRHILLASYRARVPVVGFSPAQVKAGTVAAVFSSPGQIGAQAAAMARRWLVSGRLPESQHAGQFSVDINGHVARSMGLALPGEREVARQLGAKD